MGNVALCAPLIISNAHVKILSTTDGELLIYTKAPVKAAEVMLENPGQFLCLSSSLRVGQRIPGMCADEELEKGQFYFLLPMEMLYSVLTDEEMKVLRRKASKGMKRVDFSKIFPELNSCLFPGNNSGSEMFEAVEDESARFSRQRSWQPALETIVETPLN